MFTRQASFARVLLSLLFALILVAAPSPASSRADGRYTSLFHDGFDGGDTSQWEHTPDWYTVEIEYEPDSWCLESKSLKLYLGRYRNDGAFCEALAVQIRDDVADALDVGAERVQVTLAQKARGGISITATA